MQLACVRKLVACRRGAIIDDNRQMPGAEVILRVENVADAEGSERAIIIDDVFALSDIQILNLDTPVL